MGNWLTALTGWGKGGNVTSAGWQVILRDPIWHVSSRSSEAFANCYTRLLTYLLTSTGSHVALSRHLPSSLFCGSEARARTERFRMIRVCVQSLSRPRETPRISAATALLPRAEIIFAISNRICVFFLPLSLSLSLSLSLACRGRRQSYRRCH